MVGSVPPWVWDFCILLLLYSVRASSIKVVLSLAQNSSALHATQLTLEDDMSIVDLAGAIMVNFGEERNLLHRITIRIQYMRPLILGPYQLDYLPWTPSLGSSAAH